jgi:hypothetical protein
MAEAGAANAPHGTSGQVSAKDMSILDLLPCRCSMSHPTYARGERPTPTSTPSANGAAAATPAAPQGS